MPSDPKEARGRQAAREIRNLALRPVEVRTSADGAGLTLLGFASVTEAPYEMADWLGPYTEVVRSGAFTKTLAEKADVRLLVNHDGIPLARTKSGTLALTEVMPAADVATTGLWVEAPLDPASPLVQEIRSAMARGDLDEMSFAFRVTRQQWSPDYEQRDILEVELFDVSVVTYPANPATSASLRVAVAARAATLVPDARVAAIRAELREGKKLSAETVATLSSVLDLVGSAHDALSEAKPTLGTLLDPDATPDGDGDDDQEQDSAALGADTRSTGGAPIAPLDLFEARLRALDSAA